MIQWEQNGSSFDNKHIQIGGMSGDMRENDGEKRLTYDDVREMVHAAVHREEWYERFVRLITDDEYFLKDILEGASEEEIERYFAEFPEYKVYRSVIG